MVSDTAILAMITGYAASCGDPEPASIQYVRGSRGELNRLAYHAGIGGDHAATPAVLVQAIGRFRRIRPGLPPEGGVSSMWNGTAISLILDQDTGQALDQSFGERPFDLAALGTVVDLSQRQQHHSDHDGDEPGMSTARRSP